MITKLSGLSILFICLVLFVSCQQQKADRSRKFVTRWVLKSSLKYETCNLIGILTGRKLYQKYYLDIYRQWRNKLPGKVNFALTQIDRHIGEEWPPGPRLCMFMSAVSADDSLSSILRAMEDDDEVYKRLMASDYGSEKNWQQWLQLKPHLKIIIEYLKEKDFESFWYTTLQPTLTAKFQDIQDELRAYDVVGDLERFLVDHTYDETVTVYLQAFSHPHELRLDSQTRMTAVNNPLKSTIRSFYHEMLHEYSDPLVDSLLAREFSGLESSSHLQASYRKISPNGSNGAIKAYFQKELVIAAELWVTERRRLLSLKPDAQFSNSQDIVRYYLSQEDDGAHILAAVIYSYLEAGLKIDRISYAEFIEDLFSSGRLRTEKIDRRYHDFMNRLTATSR